MATHAFLDAWYTGYVGVFGVYMAILAGDLIFAGVNTVFEKNRLNGFRVHYEKLV